MRLPGITGESWSNAKPSGCNRIEQFAETGKWRADNSGGTPAEKSVTQPPFSPIHPGLRNIHISAHGDTPSERKTSVETPTEVNGREFTTLRKNAEFARACIFITV